MLSGRLTASEMFGDSQTLRDWAEELLKTFSLSELLELNNLETVEVLEILLEQGLISVPE